MKWLVLFVGFCALVGLTRVVWNNRYETLPNRPELRVEGAQGGHFIWEKERGEKAIALGRELPFAGQVDILLIRVFFRAVDLIPGKEKWEDGRLVLDWVDQGGNVAAHDTLLTMRGSDKKTHSAEMIVRSVEPGLVPMLRAEHLGLSGRMEIHSFQAIAVRERVWVRWVAGGLLGLWGLWCYGFVRAFSRCAGWRAVSAAAFVLGMGWFLVVPGPWAHERAIAGDFQMGASPDVVKRVVMAREGGMARVMEPLGDMPVQGSWMLSVKVALSFLRPVLHVMLFAVPAFVMAALCGQRCAWWCGVLVSCAVEVGQAGFGFGFDWVDCIDLLVDWAGIAGAIWLFCKVEKKFGRFYLRAIEVWQR